MTQLMTLLLRVFNGAERAQSVSVLHFRVRRICVRAKRFVKQVRVTTVYTLADLTVGKRPGTSYQIEIHFAVVNHLYLLFSFVKLVET